MSKRPALFRISLTSKIPKFPFDASAPLRGPASVGEAGLREVQGKGEPGEADAAEQDQQR